MGGMQQSAVFAVDWLVVLPVVLALATSALLVVGRHARDLQWAGALIGVAAIALIDAALLWRVMELGPVAMTMGMEVCTTSGTQLIDAQGKALDDVKHDGHDCCSSGAAGPPTTA